MTEHKKHDFNYYITRFFLNNGRLTLLVFLLLVVVGVVATVSLRTTGFPNPTIDTLVINTRYQGASSQSVVDDVSIPIEQAIKDVDGVGDYQTISSNGFSTTLVSVADGFEPTTVKTELDAAVDSVDFPDNVEPRVVTPDFSGPDFTFTVVSEDGNTESLYNAVNEFTDNLEELDQTSEISVENPIIPVVQIQPNFGKIAQLGLSFDQLEPQIRTFGDSSSAGSDISIDGQNVSIETTFGESTIDDLRNMELVGTSIIDQSPVAVTLSEIANVVVDYQYEQGGATYIGMNVDGDPVTVRGVTINVKAVENTDQGGYDTDVSEINSDLEFGVYSKPQDLTQSDIDNVRENNTAFVLRNYAVNDDNEEQVNEVLQGLIGGPLEIDNPLAAIGWIFGALQLVFITMFIFVSWRAAIISALAIPLSLGFTSIYLFFTGESFNTLVLFSLVLVIGLVVDPTLVVLEAIQRKVDSGYKGKEAVLKGIDDVGIGLFTSTMTNVIVFLPFGLISGVIGQIFSYIPLTIIPAIIGSYVVALIFLSWIGGIFLRRTPNSADKEEENLWPLAKSLINFNLWLLYTRRIWRVLIVAFTFVVALVVLIGGFSSGLVESTDFSTPSDSTFILASYSFKSTVPEDLRVTLRQEIINDILGYKGVEQIFPFGGNTFFVQLVERENDNRELSSVLASDINEDLTNRYVVDGDDFFSVSVSASGPGPGGSDFPLTVGLYPSKDTDIQNAAVAVGETLQNVCATDTGFEINVNCSDDDSVVTQVNDGFTGLENRLYSVVLDRSDYLSSGLVNLGGQGGAPVGPTFTVSQSLNLQTGADSLFPISAASLTDVELDDEIAPVVIDFSGAVADPISTEEELSNAIILTTDNQAVPLESIGSLETSEPQGSIVRFAGERALEISAKVKDDYSGQGSIAQIQQVVYDYYAENDGEKAKEIGLESDGVRAIAILGNPDFTQSLVELVTALGLAIVIIYTILVVFFRSFTKPIIILYTIPLAFIGLMPGLAFVGGGQLGFLEIIGIIILVGLVVNVALYLMDSARSYMLDEGYDQKRAIATASGIRLRSVVLTTITAIASLAPLAIYSEFYRSIASVIMFGLATSGLTSLITTPVLYIFFNWVSEVFHKMNAWNKIFFLSPLSIALPISLISAFALPDNVGGPLTAIAFVASIIAVIVYLIIHWVKTPRDHKPKNIKGHKKSHA